MNANQKWLIYVARGGYFSKCVVYGVLGIMILYAAMSAGNAEQISQQQIYQKIFQSPFGVVTLTAVIASLVCYVLWRLLQCILNTSELDMTKPKEVIERVFYFISAMMYVFATYGAIKVLTHSSNSESESNSQNISAKLMNEPYGVWVVAAIGMVIIIFAGIQFKHVIKRDFMSKFRRDIMTDAEASLAAKVGRIGFCARGVVYLLVGSFFMHAAISYDADKAGGLGKALITLMQQQYGLWLLVLMGCGMLAFSAFCGFEARYRQT